MASPCKNCGCEYDQCMGQTCPECGHSDPFQWGVLTQEPKGEWKSEFVWCKICNKNHNVTKFIEKEMVKNVE